jgi:hypothetical protein
MPFIADNPLQGGFVPDTAIDTPQPKEKTTPISELLLNAGKGVMNAIGGVVEPVLQQATGMVGKTAGDIAGLAGIVGDATGIVPNKPQDVQAAVRQALTYQPQSKLGASPNNILNRIPKAIGHGIESISPNAPQDNSTLGGMATNASREIIPNAINIGVIKATPMASRAVGNVMDRSTQALDGTQSAKSVLAATDEAAANIGYKTPAATTNPNIVNTSIEGIAGKKVTEHNASINNERAGNNGILQDIGLPPDTKVFSANAARKAEGLNPTLDEAAKPHNQVYQDVKQAGPFKVDDQYPITDLSPNINKKISASQTASGVPDRTISGSDAIETIKQLRADAGILFKKAAGGNATPADLAEAKSNLNASNDLESLIERNLQSTQPELLSKFQDARTMLAKINVAKDALVEGGGTFDQRVLGKIAQSKPGYLTGNMETIGNYANNHPNLVTPLKKVGSPGVNNLHALTSAALTAGAGALGFTAGGPGGAIMAAGIPMALEALARKAALRSSTPSYTPGMAAQALPFIPPAVAAGTIAGSNQRNLTNVPTNIMQNILRNPSENLINQDIFLNKLLGGNNETISARVGRERNTNVMAAALANELDRIDPGHTQRALAAAQAQQVQQ